MIEPERQGSFLPWRMGVLLAATCLVTALLTYIVAYRESAAGQCRTLCRVKGAGRLVTPDPQRSVDPEMHVGPWLCECYVEQGPPRIIWLQ